jgi:hypothetical protein
MPDDDGDRERRHLHALAIERPVTQHRPGMVGSPLRLGHAVNLRACPPARLEVALHWTAVAAEWAAFLAWLTVETTRECWRDYCARS